MNNPRQKLLADGVISFISFIIRRGSALVIMVFLTKYIYTAGYGIWSQFNATMSFLSVFLPLNLGYALVRFASGQKEEEYISGISSAVFILVGSLCLLVAIFMICFQQFFSNFLFGDKGLALLVIFLAVITVIKNLSELSQCLLTARRQIKVLNAILLGYFVLMMVVIPFFAVLTKNAVWVIGSLVFVEATLSLALIISIYKMNIKLTKPNFKKIIPLLKFGTPLLFSLLGFWLIQLSDMYQIKYYLNVSQVGIYSAAMGIASLILIFWMSISNVLLADFSVLYDKEDKKELETRFSRALKYGIALSSAGAVGISVLAKPLMSVLTSNDFAGSFQVLTLLSIVLFFYGIFIKLSLLLDIMKKVILRNLVWFCMIVGHFILNMILIPRYGIMGAVVSTLITFVLGTVFVFLYSRLHFAISFKLSWALKIITSCTAMGLAVWLMPVSSKLFLILAVFVGAAVYMLAMFLLKFYDKSEISLIKNLLKFKNEVVYSNK